MALYQTNGQKVYDVLYDPATNKLKEAALPSVSIIDKFTASSQAEMLALTAQKGDICERTDNQLFYLLTDNDPSILANWVQIKAAAANGNFAGMVKMHGGATAPTGWLLCDGSEVSRVTYVDLFTAIGETFGVGDGVDTFNLPDFRGIFPRGAGTTNRLLGKDAAGNFYSETLGEYKQDKVQGHVHTSSTFVYTSTGGPYSVPTGSTYSMQSLATIMNGYTTDGTNGTPRIGKETSPASLGITFIIKT